jgi:hypothetical protein
MNMLLPFPELNYMVMQKPIGLGTSFIHGDGKR